jgi:hypothetical protein
VPGTLDQTPSQPFIARIRRNHALEHATIHLLAARYPRRPLIGRSDPRGFIVYADVPTEAVEQAASEALNRLRQGDRRLAVHPNCGTNLLTSGILAGSAVFLGMAPRHGERPIDRLLRLPSAILMAVAALLIAQPLGTAIQQRVTTLAEPGPLQIRSVRRVRTYPLPAHRVTTAG